MKKKAVLAAVLTVSLILSGCLGAVQIEEYGYVQSFGIDRGENKKYSYSFLLQNYGSPGQDGSGGQEKGIVIGGEGDSLFEALALVTAGLPYELNFTRMSSAFFSEDLAKDGEIEQLISMSQSALKMRNSIKLFIVHGNTREFQEGLQVEDSPDLMQMQRSILYSFSQEGTVPITNFAVFYEAVSTGRFDPIIVYGGLGKDEKQSGKEKSGGSDSQSGGKEKEDKSQSQESRLHGVKRFGGMPAYADGTALFDGMRMVGTLNGEETKFLLTARGELGKTFIYYVYDEDGMLVLQIAQQEKPKTTLKLEGDIPKAEIDIKLSCNIYMDDKGMAQMKWDKELREKIETYLRHGLEGVFKLCRDLQCDAIGLGKEASKQFSDIKAWEEYNWKDHYGKTEAEFRVSLKLLDPYIRIGIE